LPPACSGAIMTAGRRVTKARQEAGLADIEPIVFPGGDAQKQRPGSGNRVTFDRQELTRILNLYGRKVADGEWRDYAIQFLKDRAVFAIFRRAAEVPLYRIEKNPARARRQGAYAVVTANGLVLKRGHDLERVLRVIDPLKIVN
jgi:hypothetical protein